MLEWINDFVKDYAGEYTWVANIFIIVFATLLVDFFVKAFLKILHKKLSKTHTVWDDVLVQSIRTPLSLFIWVMGATFILEVLELVVITIFREIGLIVVIAWSLVRFIKQIEERVLKNSEQVGTKIDRTTADAIAQLLRLSVIITAGLVGLQTIGVNISAILAFGGIGGIAIGFAAKDLLSNFFGGLMIYLDRPFAIGDWVRSPDRDIEGTVEKIGWRLTIIRTFDKRPLYIPNSVFATIVVENPSRMLNRRIYETIGVRYADAAVLKNIIDEVKDMLRKHTEIDQEQTMMVNFNKFAASSLDFFVYTFTKTTNWIDYHMIKQDVLFKINEIITHHGAEIAFPTSTVHLPDATLAIADK
jgi:MscS family membrane protein